MCVTYVIIIARLQLVACRRGFHEFMPLKTPFLSSWIRHCYAAEYNITLYICSVVGESQATAVIYDTPSDVVDGSGPGTSENVAYGVTKTIFTTPNPAYDVVHI